MKVKIPGVLFFSTLLLPASAATIANPGFETGNLTSWQTYTGIDGGARVVTSASDLNDIPTYSAPEGSYFADLWAGAGLNIYTTVSQTFTLNSGETLDGWAAFIARDYDIPFEGSVTYNDDAAVQITGPGADHPTTLWSRSVLDMGSYRHSPWETWTFTAPSDGTYTLTYEVRNTGDNKNPSEALFDTRVPDGGATAALLAMGLLGLRWIRRTVK